MRRIDRLGKNWLLSVLLVAGASGCMGMANQREREYRDRPRDESSWETRDGRQSDDSAADARGEDAIGED